MIRPDGRASSAWHVRCDGSGVVNLYEGLELNDRLRLVRPLAEGGMANLWVAWHGVLGMEVAVKILDSKAAKEVTAKQRLLREARLTDRVAGPHVVRILDRQESRAEDGSPFLVMELLEGEDLATRIARRGRLSIDETCTVVQHMSLALESAHRIGVIHRDVKPANVFLVETKEGTIAKLVDFGIAKDASEPTAGLTRADALMGTPPFMSPEQVTGARDVDLRCDVWSLAVVAYSCLTGKNPFDGATFGAICVAIHLGRFDPPSFERPELPAALDAFFAKALSTSIELRYQSARALCAAFREATWSDAGVETEDGSSSVSDAARADEAFSSARTLLVLDDIGEVLDPPTLVPDNVPFELARPRSGTRTIDSIRVSSTAGRRGRG